ncbi:P-loop containing nucleoside triphosphate hydrolase protein [Fistulina hepatica ATCC 64428]|uniref:DNA 3'-5' helicase n=1 Tax=Fistulina hepatica ATCC 64428 TaxID=1128425 RepID=A0A0D7ADH5_9AGAR|nr:P-loop containing nucleoside triphosphate hydrolase protein [Fistulina hepatica ATCC 64428]
MSEPSNSFKFFSEEGLLLCRSIAHECLPYDPHDDSLETATQFLDGRDGLVLSGCGSGKTGIIALLAFLLIQFGQDLSLVPKNCSVEFVQNPLLLVVCPTNALEEDIALKLCKLGLKAAAVNARTVEESRRNSHIPDPWLTAKSHANVLCLSPEMLKNSKAFESLLISSEFKERVVGLIVDEAHMVYRWGANFRKEFLDIGITRVRLPPRVCLLLMTATLRPGRPRNEVLKQFALQSFFTVHRSNARPEIHVRFRTLKSSLAAIDFPELAWVSKQPGLGFVYDRSIHVCSNIVNYLKRCESDLERRHHIVLVHAGNRASQQECIRLLINDLALDDWLVVVTTDVYMLGIDKPHIVRVIIIDPGDVDELVQKMGRVGRDRERVPVMYSRTCLNPYLKAQDPTLDAGDEDGIDVDLAKMIFADCKTEQQNQIYANPPAIRICSCMDCSTRTAEGTTVPICNCENCFLRRCGITNTSVREGVGVAVAEDGGQLPSSCGAIDVLPGMFHSVCLLFPFLIHADHRSNRRLQLMFRFATC